MRQSTSFGKRTRIHTHDTDKERRLLFLKQRIGIHNPRESKTRDSVYIFFVNSYSEKEEKKRKKKRKEKNGVVSTHNGRIQIIINGISEYFIRRCI